MRTSPILKHSTNPEKEVVFTPREHADFMVREGLFWRLHQDFSNLSRNQFQSFLNGFEDRKTGVEYISALCSYQFQDPSAGDGIFLDLICSVMNDLCKKYDVQQEKKWESTHVCGFEINVDILRKCEQKLMCSPALFQDDYLHGQCHKKADIIIANPPYVRQELLQPDYKQMLREKFQKEFLDVRLSVRCDLYIYFLLKAFKNLDKN